MQNSCIHSMWTPPWWHQQTSSRPKIQSPAPLSYQSPIGMEIWPLNKPHGSQAGWLRSQGPSGRSRESTVLVHYQHTQRVLGSRPSVDKIHKVFWWRGRCQDPFGALSRNSWAIYPTPKCSHRALGWAAKPSRGGRPWAAGSRERLLHSPHGLKRENPIKRKNKIYLWTLYNKSDFMISARELYSVYTQCRSIHSYQTP